MRVLSAFSSSLLMAAAVLVTPAGNFVHAPGFSGAVPGDGALVFRKYRGADEVDDRDHSGRGSGGGGGSSGGGGGGGGGDHGGGKSGGGNKDQSASGGGSKGGGGGGKGNSNDGGDRFGN